MLGSISNASICLPQIEHEFFKAEQLKKQGQYLLASQQYSILETFSCADDDKSKAVIGYAQSLYLLNEKFAASSSLDNLANLKTSLTDQKKARLLKAWYEPEFRNKLLPEEKLLFGNYEKEKFLLEEKNQIKKPWISATLSAIIPGMGQVYNGNYQSAAISFLLNSILLATTLELHQNKLNASAAAAGLIFSITYTGNILSSFESSKQINSQYQRVELEQLRKATIPDLDL